MNVTQKLERLQILESQRRLVDNKLTKNWRKNSDLMVFLQHGRCSAQWRSHTGA